MKENFFNGKGALSMDSLPNILPLREEAERYEWLPKLMNLYGRLNGFFDDKFESFWEEQTGTPWKEGGNSKVWSETSPITSVRTGRNLS